MTSIHFSVDGIPKGQPRPRAWARKLPNGKAIARMYDAGTAEAWKSDVVRAADVVKPAAPLTGPLRVVLDFYLPRPKRLMAKRFPDRPILHTGKPDADNLAKAVLDALTTSGWWEDDAQVAVLGVTKEYHDKHGRPGMDAHVYQEEGA